MSHRHVTSLIYCENVSNGCKTIKVRADLVRGLIPESALKSIGGIYERFVDLKAVDNSHGLS